MKADLAAGKCDKSVKPIGVNALSAGCSRWSLCTESRWQSGVSADRNLVHDRTGTERSLLQVWTGLASCPINYADDLPLLPQPVNLPILSDAAGGCVECIGLRQVEHRLCAW